LTFLNVCGFCGEKTAFRVKKKRPESITTSSGKIFQRAHQLSPLTMGTVTGRHGAALWLTVLAPNLPTQPQRWTHGKSWKPSPNPVKQREDNENQKRIQWIHENMAAQFRTWRVPRSGS